MGTEAAEEGGGGGGGGGTGFSVKVDRTSISFNYGQGTTPSATVLNVTWTGTPPSQLHLLAQDDANALDPTIPVDIGSTSATVTVQPKAAMNAGTYTGHLILNVWTGPGPVAHTKTGWTASTATGVPCSP